MSFKLPISLGAALEINKQHCKGQMKIERVKHLFHRYNNRALSNLETTRLRRMSVETVHSFSGIISLYIHYPRNNVGPLLFIDPYIMEEMFLLWNYGKPEALKLLKEKVIDLKPEDGMGDVYELAYQMQNHLYGHVNQNALVI